MFASDARRSLERHDPFEHYREVFARFEHLDAVQRSLYTDCQILLPDTFLEKVDKSTMAHRIEVRVPMLHGPLTNYVAGLPSHMKVRGGQKKFILRRALRGIVPDEILDAPKTGFGVGYGRWLRGPLADYMKSVLLDPVTLSSGLFDETSLMRCIDEHIQGRSNHESLLYKLLNSALWLRFYMN